jgi:murein DD-endopeptidase MepM/ murein hydrolase activator NlpD
MDNNSPNVDPNGVDFVGSTIQILQGVGNKAQNTLDRASQTISGINQTNAKTVNDVVSVQVQQNLNRAQQLREQANPFQQLGVGLVKGAVTVLDEKQNKANEALQKSEVFKQTTEAKAVALKRELNAKSDADSSLLLSTKLREYQQNNKWATEGGTGFINEIETALRKDPNLTPDTYANVLGKAYATVGDYEAAESKQSAEALKKLQDAVYEQRKPVYLARAQAVSSKLGQAGYGEGVAPFEDLFSTQVLQPILADESLTEVQKLLLQGSARDEFNKNYPKYYESQDKPDSLARQWNNAYPEYLAAATQFEKDNNYASYKSRKAAIDAKYPGAVAYVSAPGEGQKFLNEQRKLGLESTELTQKVREANPIQLSNTSIRYFASLIITDPAQAPYIKQTLQNDAVFAEIQKTVDQYADYNRARGQLSIDEATTNADIRALQASTSDDIFRLSLSAKQSSSPALTDTVNQILSQVALSPEQRAAVLNNPTEAQKDLAILKEIKSYTTNRQSELQGIIQAKRNVVSAKRSAESSKYDKLNGYGLYGVDKAGLQRNIQTLKEPSEREVTLYNQRLQEQLLKQNTNQSLNGQLPNFSSDGNRSGSIVRPAVLGRFTIKSAGKPDETLLSPLGNNGKNMGAFSSGYGFRKVTNSNHAGIDLAAPIGTPVYSVVSGVVVNNKPVNGYGNTTLVKGDDGLFYHYAHSMPQVQIGQRVGSGEQLAIIDGSGNSHGAHLHFEVRTQAIQSQNTATIDPLIQLRKLTSESKYTTDNVKGLRQDTQSLRSNGYQGNATVVSGDGTVVVGISSVQSYTKVPPGFVENSKRSNEPTRKYYNINNKNGALKRVLSGTTVGNTARDYNSNDNYGYAYLAENPEFRVKLHQVAKRLGTHPMFLADIISQESQWTANLRHEESINPNHNVGLVGFGDDSFDDLKPETIVRMPAIQQLDVIEKYVRQNIPLKQRKDVRTLWAGIKMGTIMRNRYWKNPNVYPNAYGKPYWKDIKDLGRDAGREYLVPGYDKRSSSLKPNFQVAYGTGKSTLDAQLNRQGIQNIVIGDA